LVFSTKISKR